MLTLDLDSGLNEYVADVRKSLHNWHGGAPIGIRGCAKYIIAMALGSDPLRECYNIYMCLNGLERGYLSEWRRDKHDLGITYERCEMPQWCKEVYVLAQEIAKRLKT